MRYISLGSGSRGNATLVHSGTQALLIDSGFSRKALLQRIEAAGVDASHLSAAFVTHEHSDHAKGISALCEHLNIPFYSSFGTARRMEWTTHELWRCIRADEVVNVGDLNVIPVVVPHDASEPLQFVIENAQGRRLGILSDLGAVTPHIIDVFQGCHALQVEANHDPYMLETGPYPPVLRARVAGPYGHLSNAQCADFIARVRWSGLKHVTAGHISEKNNDRNLVQQVLAPVLECQPEEVTLLEQDGLSEWFSLAD